MDNIWFGAQNYKPPVNVQNGVISVCRSSLRYAKVTNKSNQLMYFQLFDSATAPVSGATPLRSWEVDPAMITIWGKLILNEEFLKGLPVFRYGISYGFSTVSNVFTPLSGTYPMSVEASYAVGLPMSFNPDKHSINYGHQGGPYDLSSGGQVDNDFALLKDAGFKWIRLGNTPFDYSGMANVFDLITFAKSKGFKIMWGITATNGPAVNLTRWNAFLAANPTIAAQAAALGVDIYSPGNEEGLHNDKTTLTDAQVVADMLSNAPAWKAAFNNGLIINSISSGEYSLWSSNTGVYDYIGLNKYDFVPNFVAGVKNAATAWGSKFMCTEYNIDNGLNHQYILGSELAQGYDAMQRRNALDAVGCVLSFLFCFRDGGGGVAANSYGIMTADNRLRKVWNMFVER